MPPKVRKLKSDLGQAGFTWRPGKGSHTVWKHPLLPGVEITVSGHDGDDAKKYQIAEVRERLKQLEEIRKAQKGKGRP